ncbi:hypothetical protein EBT23_06875, partial [bacterium]|nr:hypothetical protein [bacterium]
MSRKKILRKIKIPLAEFFLNANYAPPPRKKLNGDVQSMNNPPEVWVKVCRELEKVISPDALNRWFSSIIPLSYDSG